MIRKTGIIEKVKGFYATSSNLFICDNNGMLYINTKNIQSNVDGTTLLVIKKRLFFLSSIENKLYIYSNASLVAIPYACWPTTVINDDILASEYDFIDRRYKVFLFNFKKNQIINEIKKSLDIWGLLRNQDVIYFYGKSKNSLNNISLLTGEYEWELDLSGRKNPPESREEEAQIRQLVGIWQNQLIITMTNNELISIDTQTGKILWETKQLTAQVNQGPSYKWRGHLSFNGCHIESGKLYEIVGSVYYSIDLLTQAVEILWQDPRSEDYITVQHRTYTEDYIYFTGSVDGAFQAHIVGVFNRKTLSLEWIEDMSLPISPSMGYPASLNQPPQVTDNKLYVLDSGGTLHIFEKESSTE